MFFISLKTDSYLTELFFIRIPWPRCLSLCYNKNKKE